MRAKATGASKITIIVFLGIFGASVWLGYHVLNFYYCYYDLVNEMEAIGGLALTESDEKIRNHLVRKMRSLQIPADPDKLVITRNNNKIRMTLKYREVLSFSFQGKDYDLRKFDFNADVETSIRD